MLQPKDQIKKKFQTLLGVLMVNAEIVQREKALVSDEELADANTTITEVCQGLVPFLNQLSKLGMLDMTLNPASYEAESAFADNTGIQIICKYEENVNF